MRSGLKHYEKEVRAVVYLNVSHLTGMMSNRELEKKLYRMVTTLILSLALMAAFFLMLFAAVALVQDRRLFKSAPKDIQAAVLEHKEPFRGARVIVWILL